MGEISYNSEYACFRESQARDFLSKHNISSVRIDIPLDVSAYKYSGCVPFKYEVSISGSFPFSQALFGWVIEGRVFCIPISKKEKIPRMAPFHYLFTLKHLRMPPLYDLLTLPTGKGDRGAWPPEETHLSP